MTEIIAVVLVAAVSIGLLVAFKRARSKGDGGRVDTYDRNDH